MNGMRALFYIYALISIMPCMHAIDDVGSNPEPLEILYSGNYQIRYINNALALVDCDNEHRLYNLQAAIQPGSFSLPANITNQFIIAADNVQMDLSGHKVQGGVVVAPNKSDIKISNGLIGGKFASSLTNGILVYSGCRNITIEGMQITNATTGINFDNVTIGLIVNCDFSQNNTGVLLNGSSQIAISQSRAMQNVVAGFSLVNSSTCCLSDCKALSTGQGNTQTADATIFGFVSSNGYGNIFENCISNGTQGLRIVDFDSLVAGFALRGTEGCSKIIACEACNTITTTGFNVPYGILLENYFDTPLTLTGVPAVPLPSDVINAVAWSPCGKYVAAGGGEGIVTVYEFNRVTGILSRVASASLAVYDDVVAIDWHPGGMYLAVVVDTYPLDMIKIYSFCTINNSLMLVATQNRQTNQIQDVAWHPSGKFLASVEGISFSGTVYAYQFNAVAETLTLLGVGTSLASDPYEVDWSPDGNYVSIGETAFLEVYSFNQANAAPFTLNVQQSLPADTYFDVSVSWTPDGKYIAVGVVRSSGTHVNVYEFRPGILTFQDDEFLGGGSAAQFISVDWSDDSRYLMAGNTSAIRFYEFDRSIPALEQIQATSASTSNVRDVFWSPDGGLVAFGDSSSPFLGLYTALSFPSYNVIKDNVIYCTSGSDPLGIGISGSSIANMIIQNTAYSNPVDPFMVDTSYAFIPNVFNQLFGQGPTGLQNIAVGYREVIATPDDIALIAKQINSVLCNQTLSSIEVIASQLAAFSGIFDAGPCSSIPILQENIPTILSVSGVYCLGEDVTLGAQLFTITANNVVLDLNNHKVTNTAAANIVINVVGPLDNITIKNGVIEQTEDGGTSINAITGATNLTLQDLIIKTRNGLAVDLQDVYTGLINGCTFTSCRRGIRLTDCSNIVCENTQARDCSLKGFELITSSTCCFQNCKALATGVGNTQTTNQIIAGFYSSRGSANIFENCIANGTQGLSLTDANSIVAGFMLTGTESCTKIISCEASNSTTNPNGATLPYGILLENQLQTMYEVNSTFDTFNGVFNLAWSPNGKYLAVGGNPYPTNDDLTVFEFNRLTYNLTPVFDYPSGGRVPVAWSPDGQYLAVAGGSVLTVFKFDQTAVTFTQVFFVNLFPTTGGSIDAIAWSPDARFFAAGGYTGGYSVEPAEFFIYEVDPITGSFTQRATLNFQSDYADGINSIDWTPDGTFIAIGTGLNYGDEMYVYRWNAVNYQLTLTSSVNFTGLENVFRVAWSPDGRYLAVGRSLLEIYKLNKNTGVITSVASIDPGTSVRAVNWSSDGQYIVVGGNTLSPAALIVYKFDRVANSFQVIVSANPGGNTDTVLDAQWSPDGAYLAVGRNTTPFVTIRPDLFIFSGFEFPQSCLIKDNVVYCNSGGSDSRGIGISGASICNFIVGNTAYANPISPFMVNENYAFVTNVFNQLFENRPTLLQNISLGYQEPIPTPDAEALLAQQLLAAVDDLGLCGATSLTSDDVIGGTISITAGGTYCLAEDVTADMALTTTCISLDLNNHCVIGVIDIAGGDNVTVQNGFVKPAARTSNSAPVAAVIVDSTSVRTVLSGLIIEPVNSTGDAINGRTGIFIEGIDTLVGDCTIIAGNGSNATSSITGGAGGHGIELSGTFTVVRTIIHDCVIYSGNGGNATTGTNNGGDAGHGINVANGLNTNIKSVLVFSTGTGGNGTGGGTGGSGGHGIKVAAIAVDTQIFNCVLRNSGAAGTGGTGVNGKAIDDDVTVAANLSQIFSNFAHNITNATKFDLQASGFERGTLIPNPPGQSVFNILANVFV